MRTLVKSLGTLAAVITTILLVQYFVGLIGDTLSGPQGMAILGIQLMIAIGAMASMLFGLIGRILDRRANLPGSKWANALIIIGVVAGLLLFVSPYVFG